MVERMHDAIAAVLEEYDDPGLLVGWVLVAEVARESGGRMLHRMWGPIGLPTWQRNGYLFDALHVGEWTDPDTGEEFP